MAVWLKRIIIGIIIVGSSLSSFAQEELPHWRKQPKLYHRILHNREIHVSADRKTRNKHLQYKVVGVGAVEAPMAFSIEKVKEFEKLPQVSSYFKKVVHKEKEQKIYLHIRALGYETRMLVKYKWSTPAEDLTQFDWHVVWGSLKGMVGNYKFRKVAEAKTEVSTWTSLKDPGMPIPGFLMNFTLEVIAEKVAQKMRSFIEKSYLESQKVKPDEKK